MRTPLRRLLLAGLLSLLGFAIAVCVSGPTAVASAPFVVTKEADTNDLLCDSDCSLREAVVAANDAAGPDTIVVPTGTFRLSRTGAGEDATH